jgi:hypothetical protein
MPTHYDFGLRFRQSTEEEGFGSLLFNVDGVAPNLTNLVRRLVTNVTKQHPTVVFDGMVLYGSHET